jgi:hypothetical protein
VALGGEHRGTVSVDNVLELVKLFEQADYFSLSDKYVADVTGDASTYTTSIQFDGKFKQVVDDIGLELGMPIAVQELELAIDRLSDSERWTEGNTNTFAALQEERWDFSPLIAATCGWFARFWTPAPPGIELS